MFDIAGAKRPGRRGGCSGAGSVDPDCAPIAASEDFARFLEHVTGCFVFPGNGTDSAPLHNPAFDFNDAALGHGVRYHVELVRRRLPCR